MLVVIVSQAAVDNQKMNLARVHFPQLIGGDGFAS